MNRRYGWDRDFSRGHFWAANAATLACDALPSVALPCLVLFDSVGICSILSGSVGKGSFRTARSRWSTVDGMHRPITADKALRGRVTLDAPVPTGRTVIQAVPPWQRATWPGRTVANPCRNPCSEAQAWGWRIGGVDVREAADPDASFAGLRGATDTLQRRLQPQTAGVAAWSVSLRQTTSTAWQDALPTHSWLHSPSHALSVTVVPAYGRLEVLSDGRPIAPSG